MRVEYTPRARDDLSDIWEFTAQHWDIDQADKYISGIAEVCDALGRSDRTGRRVPEVREGYLRYGVASHVVFFRVDDEKLVVVRVLHQMMDPTRHLD